MSALSDQLLVVSILAYLTALLSYAVEYAFSPRSVVTRVATRDLVGATVGGAGVPDAPVPDAPVQPVNRQAGAARVAGKVALLVMVLGAVAHLATLVTRGLAADRMPWGNMYEFVLTVTFVGSAAWLGLGARRPAFRHLGLFVALTLMLLLGVAGMVLYTEVGPLVPALNSYWFVIHIASVSLASGILLVGFVTGAMYLIRVGYERGKRRFPYPLGRRLPSAEILEPLTFRLHAFAFPIWTFGVAAGAIWAEAAWGRYWGWDPKETWAFISWVVYAGYLHARATPSVKRTTATWIAVIGWLTMLMNLFGVNLFFEGLHSYSGL